MYLHDFMFWLVIILIITLVNKIILWVMFSLCVFNLDFVSIFFKEKKSSTV